MPLSSRACEAISNTTFLRLLHCVRNDNTFLTVIASPTPLSSRVYEAISNTTFLRLLHCVRNDNNAEIHLYPCHRELTKRSPLPRVASLVRNDKPSYCHRPHPVIASTKRSLSHIDCHFVPCNTFLLSRSLLSSRVCEAISFTPRLLTAFAMTIPSYCHRAPTCHRELTNDLAALRDCHCVRDNNGESTPCHGLTSDLNTTLRLLHCVRNDNTFNCLAAHTLSSRVYGDLKCCFLSCHCVRNDINAKSTSPPRLINLVKPKIIS